MTGLILTLVAGLLRRKGEQWAIWMCRISLLAFYFDVTADELIFDKSERGPDDELRLQFEALAQFTPEEKKVARAVLESLIFKHNANRFSATG